MVIGGEGITYRLVDERGCGLVVVHAGRWVVGWEEGMLTLCVIITVRVQLGNCGEINLGHRGRRKAQGLVRENSIR